MLAATICSIAASDWVGYFVGFDARDCCGAQIGIFAIAVPVIGMIMSVIVRLVTGVETAEISVDMGGIFMGKIVLHMKNIPMTGYCLLTQQMMVSNIP